MNIQLYDSLLEAKNFLLTVKENEEDLQRIKSPTYLTTIDEYAEALKKLSDPKFKQKEFSFATFFILALISYGIFGIIYAFYIILQNLSAKKKLDKFSQTPEELERKNKIEKQRARQKLEIEEKTNKYKKYYSDNYWKCLGFLPEYVRRIKTLDDVLHTISYLDGLIHYVKKGATTIDDAMKLYAVDLRELDEDSRQREAKERMEKQHKEKMDALNTIAKNQERTNDELDKLYRETYKIRR